MARAATGTLVLKNGVWHCRVSKCVNGQRKRPWYSLETADFDIAKKKRARLMADLVAGKTPGEAQAAPVSHPKFEPYARAWQAARAKRGVAMAESELIYLEKYAIPTLGGMLLGDVKARHIQAALDRAVALGKRQQTVSHIRATVGRVLKQAVRDEWITKNPIVDVETPDLREVRRERMILADEEVALFFACPDVPLELRIMALVARCEGGMRTRDVTSWDWLMIDRKMFAVCIIPRTKRGVPQKLEIPAVLQEPLRRWWVASGSPEIGPVFPVTKGKRKGEARKTHGVSFAKRLRAGLLKAGVKRPELHTDTSFSRRVDFHSFRRAFSTALAEAGTNVQQAMHLAGHADPRAHARYVMQSTAMQKIPAAALPRMVPEWSPDDRDPSRNPERDTRFELATLSLGSERRRKKAEKTSGSVVVVESQNRRDSQGTTGIGPRMVPEVVELGNLGRAVVVTSALWDELDLALLEEGKA